MNIDMAKKNTYASVVRALLQQATSRLRPYVTVETGIRGEAYYIDQIGEADDPEESAAGFDDTAWKDVAHGRRRVTPREWKWAIPVRNEDVLQALLDPTSRYLQAARASFNRKCDSLIIAAGRGTAYTGKTGTTEVVLPATQKIAVGTTGLTFSKLVETREMFGLADLNEDQGDKEDIVFVCTWKQITNMFNEQKVTSSDYNTVKALAAGEIDTYLGMKFVKTNLLPKSGTTRYCLAFPKSGIELAIWEDIVTDIGPRRDKNLINQAFMKMMLNAGRVEEERVVEIGCKE